MATKSIHDVLAQFREAASSNRDLVGCFERLVCRYLELGSSYGERFAVDKETGIHNDPNDWAREHEQPRYILDLIKRVVRVSIETMKIVNGLPPLNERKD